MTVDFLIRRIYNSQKSSSKKRGHPEPDFSLLELKEWMLDKNGDIFYGMYDKWARSGYVSHLKPSIDRLNNSIHYTFENIQLTTWGENNKKGHLDSIKGHITTGKNKEAVYKIGLDGVTICLYQSINIASRDTDIDDSSIIRCCKNKVKTAGNFTWRYYNEKE